MSAIITKAMASTVREIQDKLVELDPGFSRRTTPLLFSWNQKMYSPVLRDLANSCEFILAEEAGSLAAALGEDVDMGREAREAFYDFLNGKAGMISLQCWAEYHGAVLVEYCPDMIDWLPQWQQNHAIDFLLTAGIKLPEVVVSRGSVSRSGCGHARRMAADNSNWWFSRRERRQSRGSTYGRKAKGSTLADKRRGVLGHRARTRAVWF